MAMRAYNNVSAEEKAWAYHLSMDRAEADYWNGLELAEEKGRNKGLLEGLEDGIKQGERNKALSDARNALVLGLSFAQVSQITGLSLAEVEQLAAQL